MTRPLGALALLALVLLPAPKPEVPPPEAVLGFPAGEDRHLADWRQIAAYMRRLEAASPRVRVEEVGRTTEGKAFLIVTITSEANQARLEEIRRGNLRLSDPRGLTDEEAGRLVAAGKTIVAMNYSIHSTEVGGSLTGLRFAHLLAATDEPALLHALEETVLLLIPSQNPDGTEQVAAWYRAHVGTAYEGTEPPGLYQKYAGHDNNRDWYMFTQAETLLTVRHLYDRWRPQIVHDVHQMGPRGARMFLPPYLDPWEPNVDPALVAAVNALGAHVAARLTAQGKRGVLVHGLFDAWTPARAYPHTHGAVRILSETASTRLASPLSVAFSELQGGAGYDPRQASWNFPAPWPGGAWHLSDVVDYQLAASRAILEHAAGQREKWLRLFLEVGRRASARTEPFAFVLPAAQRDPLATARLLEVLRTGSVEVQRAQADFEAGGRSWPAGSHVVLMQQPFSAFAKTLLEPQHYPDLRQCPGGPPVRPYDATAHTLPLLMGVDVEAAPAPFAARLEKAPAGVAPGRIEGQGRFLALGHGNADLIALARLLRARVPVLWAREGFTDDGRSFPPGSLLTPAFARAALEPMARALGVVARGVNASPPALALRQPKIGLYQSWVAPMDEGWTRFVFERQVELAYETIHDRDVRTGKLRARFDAIVLPDQAPRVIVKGHAPGSLPDEYTGGIGTQGVRNLRAFVEDGGTLVTLDSASLLPIGEFGLPLTNALAGLPSESFFCPGSILRVSVDRSSPLGHGLEAATPIWFESSPAFDVRAGTVVARYGEDNPLLSGWLLGERRLAGKAALVDVAMGKGHVVLFGFRPQYRAQSWATYVALLNALYLSAATPGR